MSKNGQDVTLRMRQIYMDRLESWEPTEDQKDLKEELDRRRSTALHARKTNLQQ